MVYLLSGPGKYFKSSFEKYNFVMLDSLKLQAIVLVTEIRAFRYQAPDN